MVFLRRLRLSYLKGFIVCSAVVTCLQVMHLLIGTPSVVPREVQESHVEPFVSRLAAPDVDELFQNANCSCARSLQVDQEIRSTCSLRADTRGNNQKVVSFVFYLPEEALRMLEHGRTPATSLRSMSRRYFDGILINAARIPEIYGPDWIMRLYVYIPRAKFPKLDRIFCQLECQYPNLDMCRVDELHEWKFMTNRSFAIWRFLPLADDHVSVFLSRDLDSRVTEREKVAVDDWLHNSTASLHVMRDHPLHGVKILAGGWGMNLERIQRTVAKHLMINMTSDPSDVTNKFYDQPMLERVVWERLKGDAVQHDSYFCEEFQHLGFRPFPTQRKINEPWNFVGANERYKYFPPDKPCPEKCRPVDHKDWLFC